MSTATASPAEVIEETLTSSPHETSTLDLKGDFDPNSAGDWCELLKDIAAMANTTGGRIVVGINDDGEPSGISVAPIVAIDPAVFVDKVFSYTGVHFAGVSIASEKISGAAVAVFVIDQAPSPLVFNKAGNYLHASGRQKCAFSSGTLYVRHGAKSEPATSDDLRDIIERRVKRERDAIISTLQRVADAPVGSVVSIAAPVLSPVSDPDARPVRLVIDPSAAAATILDPNITHPHRQRDVVARVNANLKASAFVTANDIVAIRRIHKTEEDRSFFYRPKTGTGQYSDLFVQWVTSHIESNREFLPGIRARYHEMTVERNRQRKKLRHRPA